MSEGTRVPVYTLKNPEKQTDYIATAPVMEEIKPFLPIIMGASGGLVLIGLLIIIIVRMRSSGGQDRNMNTVNNTCANHTPTNNNLSNGKDALLFHFITSWSESDGKGQRKNMLHILLPKINKTEII